MTILTGFLLSSLSSTPLGVVEDCVTKRRVISIHYNFMSVEDISSTFPSTQSPNYGKSHSLESIIFVSDVPKLEGPNCCNVTGVL